MFKQDIGGTVYNNGNSDAFYSDFTKFDYEIETVDGANFITIRGYQTHDLGRVDNVVLVRRRLPGHGDATNTIQNAAQGVLDMLYRIAPTPETEG